MAHRRFFRAFSAHSGKPLRGVLGAHHNHGALPRAAVRAAKLARQQASSKGNVTSNGPRPRLPRLRGPTTTGSVTYLVSRSHRHE